MGIEKNEGYEKVRVVEGYDIWASTYDDEHNPLIASEQKITLGLIGDVRNKRVLDVGCGTGRYCELLAKKGANVTGVDPSSRMLEYARKKITHGCTFELHLGKIEDASFPSSHFDIVVSALTVGHIPDMGPVIRKISSIIKKRGTLIVSDMHPYWFVSGFDYVQFADRNGQKYRIPEYAHLFEEYWSLFRKFRFSLENVRETRIDDKLLKSFPNLIRYKGMPLALILKAIKE